MLTKDEREVCGVSIEVVSLKGSVTNEMVFLTVEDGVAVEALVGDRVSEPESVITSLVQMTEPGDWVIIHYDSGIHKFKI